ncbi:MAG: hypothetical protein IJH94_06265 [Clostridia bacterium]|nr:hypothetical protein [Clostridia bacterium]
MWTEVYMSQNKIKTDAVAAALEANNIMTMRRSSGEDDYSSSVTYIILVPQTELESAQDVIFEMELNIK